MSHHYPPATKLGQGYIFTGVCHSVNGGMSALGGCVPALGGTCSGGVSAPGGSVCSREGLVETPPGRPLLWAVRIILECILVDNKIIILCGSPLLYLQ